MPQSTILSLASRLFLGVCASVNNIFFSLRVVVFGEFVPHSTIFSLASGLLFLGSLCLSQQYFLYSFQVVVVGELMPQSTIFSSAFGLFAVVGEFMPQFNLASMLLFLGEFMPQSSIFPFPPVFCCFWGVYTSVNNIFFSLKVVAFGEFIPQSIIFSFASRLFVLFECLKRWH